MQQTLHDPLYPFTSACAQGRFDVVANCFDLASPDVYLIAQDDDRHIGAAAIQRYWHARTGSRLHYQLDPLHSRPLEDGMISLLYRARRRCDPVGQQASTASQFNLLAVVRPVGDGWRIVLMAESPLAPFFALTAAYTHAAQHEGDASW